MVALYTWLHTRLMCVVAMYSQSHIFIYKHFHTWYMDICEKKYEYIWMLQYRMYNAECTANPIYLYTNIFIHDICGKKHEYIWMLQYRIYNAECTANPTWGDIFECCFKAQGSKLERLFSLKCGKRDVRALSFELSKMSPQVRLAVYRVTTHMTHSHI